MKKILFICFSIFFLLFNTKAYGQNNGLNQLQTQYLIKLDRIMKDLRNSQNDVLNLRSKQLEYAKAENTKGYFEIKSEIKRAELLQVTLEKDAKDLRKDALKHYNGYLPKELYEEWEKREKKMFADKNDYKIKNVIISNELYDFYKRKGLLK
jgi:5-formyltetrahydrofolate cyclo-ligase